MRLRIVVLGISLLLMFGAACNKPSQTQDQNSAPGSDNSSSAGGSMAPNGGQAMSQNTPPAPVTITIPAGKVVTISLADEVGSKVSQPGQSFGGTLAKAVDVERRDCHPRRGQGRRRSRGRQAAGPVRRRGAAAA